VPPARESSNADRKTAKAYRGTTDRGHEVLIDALLIGGMSAHSVTGVARGCDDIMRSRNSHPWEKVKRPGWVLLACAVEEVGPSNGEER
jgi:hypothetical protein